MQSFSKLGGVFMLGSSLAFSSAYAAVDLGMNNVPVLLQGQLDTSVTFATTAALDALLGQGDFIDQSCTEALTPFPYDFSTVISALQKYGVVEKTPGYNKCTDLTTLGEYKALVHPAVTVAPVQYAKLQPTLENIRESLNHDKRVLIGFLLNAQNDMIAIQGFDLEKNGTKYKGGLWACKQSSVSTKNYCGVASAGHTAVVIGYDDEQQRLKIRNSWGNMVGENGDFYMTYEFFKKMAVMATAVWM